MTVKPDQSARAIDNWRGPFEWPSVLDYISWGDAPPVNPGLWIERPNHVTFPICCGCGHIIWDDPHFGETVPEETICSYCFCETENE